eukprot:Rmarinus@m.21665
MSREEIRIISPATTTWLALTGRSQCRTTFGSTRRVCCNTTVAAVVLRYCSEEHPGQCPQGRDAPHRERHRRTHALRSRGGTVQAGPTRHSPGRRPRGDDATASLCRKCRGPSGCHSYSQRRS